EEGEETRDTLHRVQPANGSRARFSARFSSGRSGGGGGTIPLRTTTAAIHHGAVVTARKRTVRAVAHPSGVIHMPTKKCITAMHAAQIAQSVPCPSFSATRSRNLNAVTIATTPTRPSHIANDSAEDVS